MQKQSSRELPLASGKGVAIVDDEDFEWLRQFRWYWVDNGPGGRYGGRYGGHAVGRLGRLPNNPPEAMHRVITNAPRGFDVDHINGDTLDNRRENLRVVTHAENMQNRRGANLHSVTGVRGVQPGPRGGYLARVVRDGKTFRFGVFGTVEDADAAARAARQELHPMSSRDASQERIAPPNPRATRKSATGERLIYLRANGTYAVRPWVKDRPVTVGHFKTLAEAIEARDGWLREHPSSRRWRH